MSVTTLGTAYDLAAVSAVVEDRRNLTKALEQIKAKRVLIGRLWDYYNGDHPPLWMSEKIAETFGELANDLADNFCEIAVDALLHRLRVTGWTPRNPAEQQTESANAGGPVPPVPGAPAAVDPAILLDEAITAAALAVWEENDLDLEQEDLYRQALVAGEGFLLVEQPTAGQSVPTVAVQDSAYVHVQYGSMRRTDRRYAVKVWLDEDLGAWRANVYYPDRVSRMVQTGGGGGSAADSLPDSGDRFTLDLDDPGGPHGFDRVPMVPFHRRRGGPSRLRPLVPVQDKINKLSANKMVAAEFGAFRQRYFLTTQSLEDGALKNAPDRAILLDPGTPDAPTSVGEFSVTDLDNYDKAIEAEIDKFFTIALLPRHLRQGSASNVSGDAIKADEGPFVALVDNHADRYGAAWRDVFDLLGIPVNPSWADTEVHNDLTTAQVVAAFVRDAGLPLHIALERYAGFAGADLDEARGASEAAAARSSAMAALATAAFDQGGDPATTGPAAFGSAAGD